MAKEALAALLSRPVLVKLGGSILTDKHGDGKFRKAVAKRLLAEIARTRLPLVVVHGAGSHGHPQAGRHGIGKRQATEQGVSEVLAAVGLLHAQVMELAVSVGLRPVSVPLHLAVHSEGDQLLDLPVQRVGRFLEEGFTPMLHGTIVRDDRLGWRIASGDEILAELAMDLEPRLVAYATDIDGVFAPHPEDPEAHLLGSFGRMDLDLLGGGDDEDATGAMLGKLERALGVAEICPTWIVNGNVRGRVHDLMMGKAVPGTRLTA